MISRTISLAVESEPIDRHSRSPQEPQESPQEALAMMIEFGPDGKGSPLSTPRRITYSSTYNCTHSSAFGKGRRDGDNPATATAAAFSHTRGAVHYPPAIFEAAMPINAANVDGHRVIATAVKGSSKPLTWTTPQSSSWSSDRDS
jgi:hypothetical protein